MNNTAALSVISSIILLVACDAPEMPAVSKPVPRLDGDDRAVMKAVLDDFLRPERDQLIQRGRASVGPVLTTAPFLVFDATIAVCEGQKQPIGVVPGCLDSRWLEHLRSVTRAPSLSAVANFKNRNTRALPIRGSLSDDMVFMPTGIDGQRFQELIRRYQSPHVVVLSAPAYPSAGAAVIGYRYFSHGLGIVGLKRSNGGWAVATHSGTVE